ncbi:hypothetical protein [Bizionia paragorgiae]|uniref:FEKKY domain-containing protein n=1 Tax=Bizionia paragorgiae TaxID=283786 RepID=UPI003A916D61
MKFILTVIFGIISLTLNAQKEIEASVSLSRTSELKDEQLNNSGASKLTFITEEKEGEKLAKLDIHNGTPLFLLIGGIAPTTMANDSKFENKYEIYFYDFGCTGPDHEIVVAYNITVAKYLNKRYGMNWLKEVKNDIIGFKEWTRK